MTNEEKLQIVNKYLDLIQSVNIRTFTEYCLLKFPAYFWSMKASTSGNRHGKDETLLDHIDSCIFLGQAVCEQMDGVWTQRVKDQLISALLLHDGYRCGAEGEETRWTEEDKRPELIGQLKTTREHAEIAFLEILKLSIEFNRKANEEKTYPISGKDLSAILNAVRLHLGPWGCEKTRKEKPFCLDFPASNLTIQVHFIDMMSAQSSKYWNGKEK